MIYKKNNSCYDNQATCLILNTCASSRYPVNLVALGRAIGGFATDFKHIRDMMILLLLLLLNNHCYHQS